MERFVQSPFFNRKAQLVRLFQYLLQCRATKQMPQPEEAFRAAHPEEAYSVAKLRLAYSDLLTLTEQYWTVHYALQATLPQRRLLAAEYRKRGLPKHGRIALREARQAADAMPIITAGHFAELHDLEVEIYQAAAADVRNTAFNLQRISDLSDLAYIAQKLQHVCTALSHQAVFRTSYRFGMLEAIYGEVERENFLQYPAIALYYHAAHFLTDASLETHFTQFIQVLQLHGDAFAEEETRSLYLLAINFGIKKCNTGLQKWYRITFDLYREALEKLLLPDRGVLSRFAYNNIAIIGGKLGETSWVESFLAQYKSSLERTWREASFSLNMARLEYGRRRYKEALHYLQRADYKDFINSMNAKILQMKVYYETSEYAVLESHLDSMQNYIRRQRAAGYHRENFLNIIHITRQLLYHATHNMPPDMEELRKTVQNTPTLTERDWLLAQINDDQRGL